MKIKKQAFFKSGVSEVWNKTTDLSDQLWRSDISRVDSFEQGKKFRETTKKGAVTEFEVILFEPVSRYACKMENEKFSGSFSLCLSIAADGSPEKDGTRLILTEEIKAKNPLLAPAMYCFVRAAMARYMADLALALGEKN